MEINMKVEIKNLSYVVGKKKIINDINFSVEGKKVLGVLGPNGAGKSTLLKFLYRELASNGKISINKTNIETIPSKLFHQNVGVLAQFSEDIDPNLKVKEVLLMGRYPYKELFSYYNKDDYKIVDNIVKKLSLQKFYDRYIGNLSGGEFQRVMIGKVLVSEPRLIILDEPTNHLDIKYKIDFMEILKKFNGLVIVSLHDLSLAAKYCDEIILLKEGELIEKGVPKKILTEKLLSSIYEVDYKVIYEPEFIIYYS